MDGSTQGSTSLYERDFTLWLAAQADALRRGDLQALDIPNLADEVEGLARSDRREIRTRMGVLLMHLLKCLVQPDRYTRSWTSTVIEQRRAIEMVLADSPSLRSMVGAVIEQEYPHARAKAAAETRLDDSRFPEACPWTEQQVMDPDFMPDA